MPLSRRRPVRSPWQESTAGRVVLGAGALAGGLTLAGLTGAAAVRLVTPGPVAWTVRRLTTRTRPEHPDVPELEQRVQIERDIAVPVQDAPDTTLDLYRPTSGGANPTVLWWHGGGFVGGDKSNGRDFAVLLASHGFTVAQLNYSLAPDEQFPVSLRQARAGLQHLVQNAETLGVDPQTLIIGGDSAGAAVAAQLIDLHANPELADAVGLEPVVAPEQIAGAVLYCGMFNLFTVGDTRFPLVNQMIWAYLGRRDWKRSPLLRAASPVKWVTSAWPSTFVSVGDTDPLRQQSHELAEVLEAHGVAVTRSFHEDSRLNLQHEFQFAYRTVDGRAELDRTLAFLERLVRR